MNDHLKGLAITATGVMCVVPDSLFVRLIHAEPLVTAFWRALIAGLAVLIVVLCVQGITGFRAVLRTGRAGLIYTVVTATTAPAFVLAVANTSVANVVLILASMPLFAALFSRVFLGERIAPRMIVTMVVVAIGLAIIAYGSNETQIASWKGDLWAVYVSAAFAAALTAVRTVKSTSMIPAIPIAYIGAAVLLGGFVSPLPAFEAQWPLILTHGSMIGAGACFLALGPRYISSVEVALFVLLESVLAPLLAWAIVGEHPGKWAIVGGAVVIGALLATNLYVLLTPHTRRDQSALTLESELGSRN